MSGGEFAAIEARADKLEYLEPCPNGCGCKYLDDADRYDCACSGPCCTEEWDVDTDTDRRPELGERVRDIETLLAAVRERDNTIARVRELHVRNQDGSWTCGDWECEKCTRGDGHHGPVCDTCSFSTDDDIVPSVVFWPCPTMQILDSLPAPGLRAALDPQETH